MPTDKKITEEEEYDNLRKKEIFDLINSIYAGQVENINIMEQTGKYLGLRNIDIPNIGVTINNKLMEISKQFKEAGISIFSEKIEKYNRFTTSFVGDSIIQDFIGKLHQAYDVMDEYVEVSSNVAKSKAERFTPVIRVSPIQKFFAKIKSFFIPVTPIVIEFITKEEEDLLQEPLDEYKDIDSEIWNYKLENNLIDSIVAHIRSINYSPSVVPRLLEKCVVPNLEKLELSKLIPKLQTALIEEYKKDLPASEFYKVKEEEMELFVPNFDKTTQESEEMSTDELRQLNVEKSVEIAVANGKIENVKTSLQKQRDSLEDGITIKDFSKIDSTVSAQDRHEVMKIITQELSVNKNNEIMQEIQEQNDNRDSN